jgi:hypothetical protein
MHRLLGILENYLPGLYLSKTLFLRAKSPMARFKGWAWASDRGICTAVRCCAALV